MDVVGNTNIAGGNVEQLVKQLSNGGLETIIAKLQESGLGNVVASWIGTGANLPVDSDQLHAALGPDTASQLASSLGVSGTQLASLLPSLIDQLTPNGNLPEGGVADLVSNAMSSGAVKNILGGLFK